MPRGTLYAANEERMIVTHENASTFLQHIYVVIPTQRNVLLLAFRTKLLDKCS